MAQLCSPAAGPVQDVRQASCCFFCRLLQKTNPNQTRQKSNSTTLLHTEHRKIRQKSASWDSNWCLCFFISMMGPRTLFRWTLLFCPRFFPSFHSIAALSATGGNMPQLLPLQESYSPFHLIELTMVKSGRTHAVGLYWAPKDIPLSNIHAWETPNQDWQDFLCDPQYAPTFCLSCILGS